MIDAIYQKPVRIQSILKFTFPTILMTLIQSLYSIVDGVFISNVIGENALSALTLISPYFNILTAIAAMFASGGSAIVMKKMGEGKQREARQDFTMLLLINLLLGAVLTVLGVLFAPQLAGMFGAFPVVTEYCKEYLSAYLFFVIAQFLFSNLQMYVIAAGGSRIAMFSALFGGIFNIVFDFMLSKKPKGDRLTIRYFSGHSVMVILSKSELWQSASRFFSPVEFP